jgi:UDP-glucuronate decarboxylase
VRYQHNPIRTLQTAVLGTMNMLQLARDTGARILISSTSEIYGEPLAHPQREEHWGHVNPIGKRACYDEGKRCGEAFAVAFREHQGVDARLVRIFNTYGPRMQEDDGRVVPSFIQQALRGEPLTVFGDGSQTRSLCYQSDLIEGLVAMMQAPDEAGPVNLGNPHEMTVLQIAEVIRELTGSRSEIEHGPLPSDDPTRRLPDITRARARLGWEPRVGLAEGLAATIEYFRGRLPARTNGKRARAPARAKLALFE